MSPDPARSLISLFFGPGPAAAYDPLRPSTLLQLSSTLVSQEDIVEALERQTARIQSHPLGPGPQGQQLILLLRAAAADLLARFPTMPAVVTPASPSPIEAMAAPPSPVTLTGLEEDAARLIAARGIVDHQVIHKLTELATMRGFGPESVGQTIRNLAGQSEPAPRATSRTAHSSNGAAVTLVSNLKSRPGAGADESTALVRRFVLIGGGIFVVVIALLVAAIVYSQSGGGGSKVSPAPVPPSAAAPGTTPNTPPQPAAGLPGPASPRLTLNPDGAAPSATESPPDLGQALRQTRRLAEEMGEKPVEASGKFAAHVQMLGAWWWRADAGQRGAIIEALVDCIYRAAPADGPRSLVLTALTPIVSFSPESTSVVNAESLAPALFQAGVLTRLGRERDLPGPVRDWVNAQLGRLLGPEQPRGTRGFDDGVLTALRLAPLTLISPGAAQTNTSGKAISRWYDCAAAIVGSAPGFERALDVLVLDAIEAVMVSGSDARTNRAAFDAIGALASRIHWRAGEDSRLRVLAWFADPRVPTPALNVLTTAIVTRSSAEGVDLTMVLPIAASQEQRAALRETYAHSWQIQLGGPVEGVARQWVDAARQLLHEAESPKGSLEALVLAARLARLNEAAVRRQRQQPEAAAQAIAKQLPNHVVQVVFGPAPPGEVGGDGAWALKFITGDRNSAFRRDRIRDLETVGDQIGPVDAEVLADIAMGSLAPDVRTEAQKVVARFNNSQAMIHAVLKMLPRSARLQSVATMIENVTGRPVGAISGERWAIDARRGLVEKLLELVAEQSTRESVDRVAAQIAEAYTGMAGKDPSAGGYTDEQAGTAAREMAESLWLSLRAEAQRHSPNPRAPIRLDDIDRRRDGRLTVASGPVQVFAAEQVACVEAMAYVVTGESPGRAAAAKKVIEDMSDQRRRAKSIFEQVLATERAMMRLWMLRFGEEEA